MEQITPVVIDNGSYCMKAGFAGDDNPRATYPSIIGLPRQNSTQEINSSASKYYIGDEALSKRRTLSIRSPIQRGIVTNWDDMEKIWHHTFYTELRIAPEEAAVVLTEPTFNPKQNREKMTQIMCETFNVPLLHISNHAVLALLASKRTTGLVLDSGHGVTMAVPVHEGQAITHAAMQLDVGGQDVTDHLTKMFLARPSWDSWFESEINRIKEMDSYVALDYEGELNSNMDMISRNYDNPNGSSLVYNAERFKCSEIMFKPSLLGLETDGIHEMVRHSILKCPELQKYLYSNIILTGGNTMIQGLADRLQKEVTALAPKNMPVQVVAAPSRKYSTWEGGSAFASMPGFFDWCITQEEYNETGPAIVHRKCC